MQNNGVVSSMAASSGNRSFRSEVTAIWEMHGKQLEGWIRSSSQKLSPPQLLGIVPASGANSLSTPQKQQHEYVHMTLWKKIQSGLDSLRMVPIPQKVVASAEEEQQQEEAEPHAKRVKREPGGGGKGGPRRKKARIKPIRYQREDPYQLWLHIPLPQKNDDDDMDGEEELGEDADVIPETTGGRISQLGVAGFVNALVLQAHGHVHNKNVAEPKDEASRNQVLIRIPMPASLQQQQPNAVAVAEVALTAVQVHRLAVTWHRIVQAEVRQDILITTPLRIQDMLAADLSAAEFSSIRRRIYDTVVLGRGIHVNDADNVDETLATAQNAPGAMLEVEKFKKCPTCGNNDQSAFVLDRKNGDVICNKCGTVVSESLMHEGSQYRTFEGEMDRNHHGGTANPLLSDAHNMSTTLSGVQQSSGAGAGGWRSGGGGRNLETILRNAHDYIELNVSQLGKTDRRTRVGYKDRQKKDAFVQMGHVGDALSLHEAVVQRARELFAGFRDDRELVQQFKGVVAACLCEAYEQLSQAGLSIMRGDDAAAAQPAHQPAAVGSNGAAAGGTTGYSARAARRNELHHAKLAGKGGLLLDFSDVATAKEDSNVTPSSAVSSSGAAMADSPAAVVSPLEETPAKTWDLEHCRTWLLEAAKRIAQQWVEERNKGTAMSKRYPSGTQEELEGTLVEHAFTLCEKLEEELMSRAKKAGGGGGGSGANGGRRVVTPRAQMGKLGIKWQHSHERGSGGKGGVGGSGTGGVGSSTSKLTAGQALILKTAKKLGAILNDTVAGEAIHKELRAVVDRQKALELKERRQEASRQRLQQMKRKPYLLARVQADT